MKCTVNVIEERIDFVDSLDGLGYRPYTYPPPININVTIPAHGYYDASELQNMVNGIRKCLEDPKLFNLVLNKIQEELRIERIIK